jgi:hypothetical protein
MEILDVSKRLEDKLEMSGYCGRRVGSGCTIDRVPVRDVQYFYSDKKPTEDIVNSFLQAINPSYKASLKLMEDSFTIYVQSIN